MELKFKSLKWNNGIYMVICLVLGVLFLIWPEKILSTGSKLIASIILIGSIGSSIYFIGNKSEKTESDYFYLLVGIIGIAFGFSIFINPTWIIASINILIGVALILSGISNMSKVFIIKSNDSIWWTFLIIPVITLILGFIVMANPVGMANFMTRLEGISLIVNTISTWSVIYRLNKYNK